MWKYKENREEKERRMERWKWSSGFRIKAVVKRRRKEDGRRKRHPERTRRGVDGKEGARQLRHGESWGGRWRQVGASSLSPSLLLLLLLFPSLDLSANMDLCWARGCLHDTDRLSAICDLWSDSKTVCECVTAYMCLLCQCVCGALRNCYLSTLYVCVCMFVFMYLFRLGMYSIKTQKHAYEIASVCMCVCVLYVCVWTPISLHWALTFMEPAGHVRAHNDPRERPWAEGGPRRCLGVWVLMEAWRREARNCCLRRCVCVCIFCVCVHKNNIAYRFLLTN